MSSRGDGRSRLDFHGSRLGTFENNGERWVAMRPVVDGMGMSWGGQSEKLSADPGRFNYSAIRTVGADGSLSQEEPDDAPPRSPALTALKDLIDALHGAQPSKSTVALGLSW